MALNPKSYNPNDRIAAMMVEFGFKDYEFMQQCDVSTLDISKRVQARFTNVAPKKNVDEYALQMRRTDKFPAIVITQDGFIVDGNTRVEACRKNKARFFSAFVIKQDYLTASTDITSRLEAMAESLNNQNGERLDTKEKYHAIQNMIRQGTTNVKIEELLGAKSSTITRARRGVAGQEKLSKVGIDYSKLDRTQIETFGNSDVVKLNDIPYKDLVQLSIEADFTQDETIDIAKKMHAKGADSAAIDLVAETRAESEIRIRDVAFKGKSKSTPAHDLRLKLSSIINKWKGHESTVIETNPAFIPSHLTVLETTIQFLTEVSAQQKARESL